MLARKIAILVSIATINATPMHAQPIEIGSRLEPFIDDFLIESQQSVTGKLHPPIPREVALVHDASWEGNVTTYHTVFQDGDRYRMYYRGQNYGIQPGSDKAEHLREVVCYAESRDGIHWTKPELGLVAHERSKKNNIVWDGSGHHNFAPFKDANPDCKPEQRYKAIGSDNGLVPLASPDGIHWSKMSDKRLPIVFVERSFKLRASRFGRYRSFRAHSRMRCRVCTFTNGLSRNARETVAWVTPHRFSLKRLRSSAASSEGRCRSAKADLYWMGWTTTLLPYESDNQRTS